MSFQNPLMLLVAAVVVAGLGFGLSPAATPAQRTRWPPPV